MWVICHFVNESSLLSLTAILSRLSDRRHVLNWFATEGQYFRLLMILHLFHLVLRLFSYTQRCSHARLFIGRLERPVSLKLLGTVAHLHIVIDDYLLLEGRQLRV